MEKPDIVVIIPAYKVENQIQEVLKSIPDFVKTIIVVNDASPDATVGKVRLTKDPRVILLSHSKNKGVGGAMLSGYAYALNEGVDILVKVDGDGQMDPLYIPLLIKPIIEGEADYVKGNRFLHFHELKRMPLMRRIGNWILTFMTKAASGYWNIFDPTNGYTAISASSLGLLDPKKISRNYFFETSMLCELRKQGSVVRDVPIPAIYNGENSSLNISRQVLVFSTNLFIRFINRVYYRYFLFDFNAGSLFLIVGSILVLFGLVWGITNWMISAQSGIPATTGTVLIAVLPMILGVQLLIQSVAWDINDIPKKDKFDIVQKIAHDNLTGFEFKRYFSQLTDNKEITIER
jgi:glycosyltransferase involved in cell wall biosynthesis